MMTWIVETLTANELLERSRDLPDYVEVDMRHGWYELEYLAAVDVRGGVWRALDDDVLIVTADNHEYRRISRDAVLNIRYEAEADDQDDQDDQGDQDGDAAPDDKTDGYIVCPNCGSFHIYRDVRDSINSCHQCGFTHFVGVQTVADALAALDDQGDQGDQDAGGEIPHLVPLADLEHKTRRVDNWGAAHPGCPVCGGRIGVALVTDQEGDYDLCLLCFRAVLDDSVPEDDTIRAPTDG